jgi:hypothetical protein
LFRLATVEETTTLLILDGCRKNKDKGMIHFSERMKNKKKKNGNLNKEGNTIVR